VFKHLGIKSRVLLLTLLPSTLLALVLGACFTWMHLIELKAQLLQRGEMIIQQLAPLSATALSRNDALLLERLADETLEQADVRSVIFLSAERQHLAHAGPSMINPPLAANGSQLTLASGTDATRFLLPVFGRHRALAGDQTPEQQDRLLGWVEVEMSHDGTLLRSYHSLLTSLLLIGAGLVITAIFAVRMSRSIDRPIEQIKRGVALLREGHLQTRLGPLGNHELDELAAGINRMAEALQNAQEELQNSVDQATEDVRQNLETIEIQNIELDLARKEALEASRIKSEFLANMSHEIRTPLNGIIGFAKLLQKSPLDPRQQDHLETLYRSAESLLGMINEILDFSKIEAGKLVLENVPFNMRDLVQDTLAMLAPAAHSKNLELVSLIYRDTPLSLQGDPQRLKQILVNLVGNAVKFTHEGTITVRVMAEDEDSEHAQLRISVQDTGVGLSRNDIRALFQAFSQADNSLSRQTGGTGLGLVISKRLIEQMGGEIGVESEPETGSEFWITLKLPKATDDGDELPREPLLGRHVALLESHELARQALQHQLEDCGLTAHAFISLDSLLQEVGERVRSEQPIGLAVLGVTLQYWPPERLSQQIWELERLGCKSLVLCPTTEQSLYHEALPLAQGQLQVKPVHTRKLQQALVELVDPTATRRPGIERQAPPTSRPPRLLCVDDNPANLLLVKTLLEDQGAEVVAVDSGQAALDSVQQGHFDLVFMDVQMPGMDGRQTTEAIRLWEQQHERSPLPIVALTAHALANEKRALLQGGMDDYLTKPINERQLAQVVLKWTGLALRTSQPTTADAPQALRVLDAEEGLRLAAGKPDLAADMLSMLLASLGADRQAIRQAREAWDRNTLIERVHRLHGATRYCGVPQLRAACQRSETLLKQDDPAAPAALDELDSAIVSLAKEGKVIA
jgi:two-component system sensor histidine kinase BarA